MTEAKSLNKKRRGGSRGQSLVQGAAILTFGTILVKVIGAIFKIPLGNVIGEAGMGYFSAAYALYLPVYTLSAAGFPSALARQVAENTAMGRYKDARKVHRVAQRVFLITGILGFIAMAAGGFVYINFVDRDSIYSVLAMSPSVFFCCMMASYRGYYEGLRNMTPTAVSQVIEALGKLFIGLGLAIGIMKYGEYSFQTSLTAYGTTVNTLEEARIASYPFAAAGSLAGIALGSLAGLIYMLLRSRKYGDELTDEEIASSPAPRSTGYILRNFFSIGIPIALGVLVLNVTQVIDAITIQNRLDGIDPEILRGIYRNYMSGVTDDAHAGCRMGDSQEIADPFQHQFRHQDLRSDRVPLRTWHVRAGGTDPSAALPRQACCGNCGSHAQSAWNHGAFRLSCHAHQQHATGGR